MRRRVILVCGLGLLLGLGLFRRRESPNVTQDSARKAVTHFTRGGRQAGEARSAPRARSFAEASGTRAEQEVREKLSKFGRLRRGLAYGLAKKNGVEVPREVERFFNAVEGGDWDEIEAAFTLINGGDSSIGYNRQRSAAVNKMWPAIIDAFGAAQQVHSWPAQALLDYGNSILESLRPGMVYAGGTDSSRWIPALMNDTTEDSSHIVITQNGLVDSGYLEYLQLQFDSRMRTLTDDESHELYQGYLKDAQKRMEHDEKFPNEPKQIRPNEEIRMVDGKLEASGRDAVFDMNERLLRKLIEKNPELSFAVGESVPLKGTYADAVPIGHLMEVSANGAENFTAERAAESVKYWEGIGESILSNPETEKSDYARKTYSHDAVAAGNLLAAHRFNEQAESAYRTARELWPASPEVVANLATFYGSIGRETEGREMVGEFLRKYPDEKGNVKMVLGADYSRYVRE